MQPLPQGFAELTYRPNQDFLVKFVGAWMGHDLRRQDAQVGDSVVSSQRNLL
jgi:hypothetical protein